MCGKTIKLHFLICILLVFSASSVVGGDNLIYLSFYHTHTKEKFSIKFRADGNYSHEELQSLNYFLRDFRTGETHDIDIGLLHILYQLKLKTNSVGNIEIISAYRSPKTNNMLHKRTTGVVKNSLHLHGRALDIRFSDVGINRLHKIARKLKIGGVGYYPQSEFIHIDVGKVRYW